MRRIHVALVGASALALFSTLNASAWQIRKAASLACVGDYDIAYTKDAAQPMNAPEIVTWVCSPSPSAITKIIIPASWGGRYARLSANLKELDGAAVMADIIKNDASFLGSPRKLGNSASDYIALNINSAIVPVVAGDYFEVRVPYGTGVPNIGGNLYSWFTAEKKAAAFDGALVYKSATQLAPASTDTTLTWDLESYDLNTWHDNVTNNSRLTVPAGVSLVRIQANTHTTTSNISNYCQFTFKNGAGAYGLPGGCSDTPSTAAIGLVSSILAVSPGDYFTTYINSNKAGGTTVENANFTWFQIEAIPATRKYALVQRTSSQAIAADTPTIINWNAETADTDGFHDNATNSSRLTVPAGMSKVRLSGNVRIGTLVAQTVIKLLKNGADVSGGFQDGTTTVGVQRNNGFSAILDVTPGDYFEMEITQSSGGNIDTSFSSWFSIEEVTDPG